jgi:hypothetical protein
MATIAPRGLRVLFAVSEATAELFRHAFKILQPALDVTWISVDALDAYLKYPTPYYHALYISPGDWNKLALQKRKEYATRVTLIVLAPQDAAPTNLADAQLGIYFTAALPLDQVARHCAEIHQNLARRLSLSQSIRSDAPIAWVGDENSWLETQTPLREKVERVAEPNPPADIVMHQVTVAGDVVQNKTVFQAEGNQAITLRTSNTDKIVQHADGDQVNVNRMESAGGLKIEQHAGGDQSNVNRITSATPQVTPPLHRYCAACGEPVAPTDNFCPKCGANQK